MTKNNADAKTLAAFHMRTNKKDSFERWHKKWSAI